MELKGINNSSIHNDRMNISYGNGTLRIGKHKSYAISSGDVMKVGDDTLQLTAEGYIRVTFDGVLTYYERGFAYHFDSKCACNEKTTLLNGRMGWIRGYCPTAKHRSNGFSLMECPEDSSWK